MYESHWLTSAECQLFTDASEMALAATFRDTGVRVSSQKPASRMGILASLAMFGMRNNFDFHLQHIPGVDNGIADAFSRFNNDQFWHLTLDMDPSMMPLVSFPYQ